MTLVVGYFALKTIELSVTFAVWKLYGQRFSLIPTRLRLAQRSITAPDLAGSPG